MVVLIKLGVVKNKQKTSKAQIISMKWKTCRKSIAKLLENKNMTSQFVISWLYHNYI